DVAGNVVKTVDPNGNSSTMDYSAGFNAYVYLSTVTTPVPDQSGQHGSGSSFQATSVYDFWSGRLTSYTDTNGNVTSAFYQDPLDRLTQVVRPPGGGQTTYSYGDTIGNLYLQTQTSQSSTQALTTTTYLDGLGRATQSALSEGSGSIFVTTGY